MPSNRSPARPRSQSVSAGSIVFAVAFLIVMICAAIAVSENDGINREIGHRRSTGATGSGHIEELQNQQSEGRDFLFGSICAFLGLVGAGAAWGYLKYVESRCQGIRVWEGSPSGATTFALVGLIPSSLIGFHTTLINKPHDGVVVGYCAALAGLVVVSGLVGYYAGQSRRATGLLIVWNGFSFAVAACVFAGTSNAGGLLSGHGRSTIDQRDYAWVIITLWLAAGVAVFAAGEIIRSGRRRARTRPY